MMRLYAAAGALVGWFAVLLQYWLLVNKEDGLSFAMHSANFFSFFTILSNILVAVTLTVAALGNGGGSTRFFARPAVQTAVALYIAVTGLVYFFILAAVWSPTGWDRIADQLLHYAMPVIYLVFWIVFVPKGTLGFGAVGGMLAFPVAYAAYSAVRGSLVHWYPYFFLNVDDLGWGRVALNALGLTLAFAVLAAILVGIDRTLGGRAAARRPA